MCEKVTSLDKSLSNSTRLALYHSSSREREVTQGSQENSINISVTTTLLTRGLLTEHHLLKLTPHQHHSKGQVFNTGTLKG